ncbi:MAG: Asp-tRNA(Asn)/Glu-tRNA(Gln) amidotransferase subunit GatB [Patescibacteria group bacterium]
MADYKPTIGLEIHTELKTRTKMFCACLNNPDETEPNKNVCPVCLAHPGTLPVINLEAVLKVLKVGLALSGQLAEKSVFDRKNYFYPDLPRGFQISQYQLPFVQGGFLEIENEKGERRKIKITRVHLEEDTGRLIHSQNQEQYSLVDYNRAGVPLMELVTEPEIHSGFEARQFAEQLQLLLRYLEVSDADMEKGQLRVEPNISVSLDSKLGTKVEIKNLNSFRAVEEAIDYEIKRQIEILGKGKAVHQHNRGWDEAKKITLEQRSKEEAHDYRYFPEPDLPPIYLNQPIGDEGIFINTEEIAKTLPELPWQRQLRLGNQYFLNSEEAKQLTFNKKLGDFFEQAISEIQEFDSGHQHSRKELTKLVFNFLSSDLRGLAAENKTDFKDLKITPETFAHLLTLFHQKKISSRVAKDVLLEMFQTGKDPEEIIKEKNLFQVSDSGELESIIKKIIAENPAPVADFKAGKEQALQFLVGKIMAQTKGRANPETVQKLIKQELG